MLASRAALETEHDEDGAGPPQTNAEQLGKEQELHLANFQKLQRMRRHSTVASDDGPPSPGPVAPVFSAAASITSLGDSMSVAAFQRVFVSGDAELEKEAVQACKALADCVRLRGKYVVSQPDEYWGSFSPSTLKTEPSRGPKGMERPRPVFAPFQGDMLPADESVVVTGTDGVLRFAPAEGPELDTSSYPTFKEFRADYHKVLKTVHQASVKSFAYRRLSLLSARFDLHKQLNGHLELAEQKVVPHRDFYNVRKVDTHVHHSACMNQKHLLRFIKAKLRSSPDEVVIFRDGRFLTLAEVFKSLDLTAYDLSIDTLDMHADTTTFHRFDRFNLKYNPCGQSRLREIFIKTDNYIAGKYLAEITKEVMADLEDSKYHFAEWRLSIYGRKRSEWNKLSRWVVANELVSPNVRWMIQIPRLYEVYKNLGQISCFQDMLDNIFEPLFQVSRDPSSNPNLHKFLSLVCGFDCVDDESKHEKGRDAAVPDPKDWTSKHQPPYYYWCYYLSANLVHLNRYRASRGLTTFSFRPHCGEAGDVDHLGAAFLTASGVNHAITMRKEPAMQYLYYLTQIGIAMSPLSNNRLFLDYNRNPFFTYYGRGLNVSLSTDDPLLLHYTKEPLVEEYCVAAQVWKMSSSDMCEIARNSVLQSGFEHPFKAWYIGSRYNTPGPRGNDIHLTNVPAIRLQYRMEALNAERSLVFDSSKPALEEVGSASPSMQPITTSSFGAPSPLAPTRPTTVAPASLSLPSAGAGAPSAANPAASPSLPPRPPQ